MQRAARRGEPRKLVLSDPTDTVDDQFDDEDVPPSAPPEPAYPGGKVAGLVMAALLVLAYVGTGSRAADGPAFRAGEADAARIMDGEPWRVVTALTLHADETHLVANVTAGALLATAVCRTVGGGLGAALIVAAGAAGNAMNAAVRGPPHVSVGASTAVLGAVGVLSGLAFVRARRGTGRRGRAWLPIAAGLALLGMLGSDPRSDLGAHLWGFVAGIALGAASGLVLPSPPSPGVQRVLGAATLGAVALCWWLALRA